MLNKNQLLGYIATTSMYARCANKAAHDDDNERYAMYTNKLAAAIGLGLQMQIDILNFKHGLLTKFIRIIDERGNYYVKIIPTYDGYNQENEFINQAIEYAKKFNAQIIH